MEGTNGSDGSRGLLHLSDSFLEHLTSGANCVAAVDDLAVDVDLQHSGNREMWAVAYGSPAVSPEVGVAAHEEPTQSRHAAQSSSCIRVATRVLMSMRGNSPVCLMGSHNRSSLQLPHAAVDSVLSAAQEASRAMRNLLDCPCRANPQLQLLLAVIWAEVITSYRRVIGTYSRHRHSRAAVVFGRGNSILPSPVQQAEDVSLLRRAPLLIGNHHLEDSIETMLIVQVLGKKLQELEGLMGEIVQFAGQPETVRGVQIRIDSFLNAQLSAVKCELASLQRDETNVGGDIYSGVRR